MITPKHQQILSATPDLNKLRKGVNKTEVLGLLDKIFKTKQMSSIWQNLEEGRIIHDVIVEEISLENSFFVIKAKNEKEQIMGQIETSLPIYFHSFTRSLTFKCEEFTIKGKKLIINFPDFSNTMIDDQRAAERFSLENVANREIVLDVEIGIPGSGKFKSLKYQVLDISESGIGLELKAHHLGKLKVGEHVLIKQVGGTFLSKLESEVIHITRYNEEKNLFKAGLVFKSLLNQKKIKEILENS